jgi:hypothetical protein
MNINAIGCLTNKMEVLLTAKHFHLLLINPQIQISIPWRAFNKHCNHEEKYSLPHIDSFKNAYYKHSGT